MILSLNYRFILSFRPTKSFLVTVLVLTQSFYLSRWFRTMEVGNQDGEDKRSGVNDLIL